MILGNSNTPSVLGVVMPLIQWAMPSRYHSIHKNDPARAMVAQSEQAFLALAQNKGSTAPAVKTWRDAPSAHQQVIESVVV